MKTMHLLRYIICLPPALLSQYVMGQSSGEDFGYTVVPESSSTSSYCVGAVPGDFSVTPMGAASFNVPIEMAVGVGGLQPQLSITYSSQSGNGLLGYGFSLSGITVITRGPRDIWHDGKAGGITHGTDDAYYLDGQRLMSLTPHVEGCDTVLYCPEQNPYTKVVLHGLTGGSQSDLWFSIRTQDGKAMELGHGGARQEYTKDGAQKVNAWYVNKVTDAVGNTITYSYFYENNCVYPSSIVYGSCSVELTYSEGQRPDVLESSMEGVKVRMGKLLNKIVTKSDGAQFRSYTLNYSTSGDESETSHSRLVSITASGTGGENVDNTFPPTLFQWDYLPTFDCEKNSPGFDTQINHLGAPRENMFFYSADLNGDGLSDLVEMVDGNYGYGSTNRIYIHYSNVNTNGGVCFTGNNVIGLDDQVNILNEWKQYNQCPFAIDMDGDGKNELLIPRFFSTPDAKYYGFKVYKGTQEIGGVKWPFITANDADDLLCSAADFNNDGIGELVLIDKTNPTNGSYKGVIMGGYSQNNLYNIAFSFPLSAKPAHLKTVDMDCDGMTDIVVFYDSSYSVFWNKGDWLDHTSVTFDSDDYSEYTLPIIPKDVAMGDFNGDGILDFLTRRDSYERLYFELGNGDGTLTHMQAYSSSFLYPDLQKATDASFNVFDIDGDGKSDVVYSYKFRNLDIGPQKARTRWLCSTGSSLASLGSVTSDSPSNAECRYIVAGDFDGNGIAEIASYTHDLYPPSNSTDDYAFKIYSNQSYHAGSGRVNTITDGFGNSTQIVYKSMTDRSVYTKESDALFPVVDVVAPLPVVSVVTESNGCVTDVVNSYTYQGLKAHVQGRGLLGMTCTTVYNHTTGAKSSNTVLSRDACSLIAECTVDTLTIDGHQQVRENYYWIDSLFHQRVFTCEFASSQTTEFDGKVRNDYTENNLEQGTLNYESHGYLMNNADFTYYDDYILAGHRLQPQTVRKEEWTAGVSGIHAQTTTYEYDNRGLVTKKTENANLQNPIVTQYTYDNYGNMQTETTSAGGVESIVKQYVYDSNHRHIVRSVERGYIIKEYQYLADNLVTVTDLTRSSHPLTTTYEYDSWGNVTAETTPTGIRSTYIRGWGSSPAKKYFVLEQGTARPWVKTWYDARGREVLKESIDVGDQLTSSATSYDDYGRVSQRIAVEGNSSTTESIEYDYRDRILSSAITNSQNEQRTTTYSYGNNWDVTTVEDGQATMRKYDSSGILRMAVANGDTVTYTYNSMRKPVRIECLGSSVTMDYDDAGNRISMTDPDAGTISYSYDAYGRIISQTDARGSVTNYVYDTKGRISQRIVGGETTRYTYLSGLLSTVRADSFTVSYSYDHYGRISVRHYVPISGSSYNFGFTYGSNGLLSATRYPNTVWERYAYDCYGNKIETTVDGTTIWRFLDHTGTTSTCRLAGGLTLTRSHNLRGQLTQQVLRQNGTPLRTMSFSYNPITGSLLSRTGVGGVPESFTYDERDRLACTTSGNEQMQLEYTSNGNILSKTGYGHFLYDSDHPHAVSEVENLYGLISTDQLDTEFNAFGKIARIYDHGNGNELTFRYGPDDERIVSRLYQNGSLVQSHVYLENYEEHRLGANLSKCLFLDGGAVLIDFNNSHQLYYMLTDHQGSVTALVDTTGAVCYSATYDPWGNRTCSFNSLASGIYFERGYTGHEHLPDFGLINMNGRLYDSHLGRFLSPDNYVQLPDNSQSFNRYTYCLNNPLKYVDPDGEFPLLLGLALIGGAVNLGLHAINGDVNSVWDGLLAFGIGAASVAVGSYAGGIAFRALGGSALGVGGFGAGAAGGAAGSASGMLFQGVANHWLLGDPMPTNKDFLFSVVSGALFGGVINGGMAVRNGMSFWNGQPRINISLNPVEPVAIANSDSRIIRFKTSATKEINNFTPYVKGQQGVDRAISEFIEDGGILLEKEVTIEIGGIRNRFDFVGRKENMLYLYEVKNGPYAMPTKNQQINIPKLFEDGSSFIPVGKNASRITDFKDAVKLKIPYKGNFTVVYLHYY